MPVLPTLESSQSVFSGGALQGQQIQSSEADFGGQIAQATKGIGNALGSVSEDATRTALMYKGINDETHANDIYANGLSPDAQSLQSQLHNLQGRDAIDKGPAVMQQLRDAQTHYRDSLTDPQQRLMYDRVATQRTERELLGMQDYIDTQRKVYQNQVSDGMVNSFQQQAAGVWNNPNAFNGALQSIVVERQTHAATVGQPVEFTQAQVLKDISSTWIDRLKGMAAAGTAETALGLLNSGEDWTDSTGRARHTDVRSQIEPAQLAAIQTELSMHAASQIGVQYGTAATAPAPASESLGVRNNNPGNLKNPGTGQFQTFATPQQGIQAADDNLSAYGTKHGIDTINGVIARWDLGHAPTTPAEQKEVADYVSSVSKATGIAPDAKVDLTDKATRTKILNSMFDVESPGWRGASKQGAPVGAAAGAVSGTLPVGNAAGVKNAPAISPPPVGVAQDPEAMKANQDAASEQARKQAEAHVLQLTGNPMAAKQAGAVAASTVVGNTNAAIAAQQARQREASGALTKMLTGDPQSGAAPITSFAQLVANPSAYANYSQLSQAGQAAVIERLQSPSKIPLTQDGFNTYYRLRGQALNDPNAFVAQDLSTLYGKLPETQLNELINLQSSVGKHDQNTINKTLDWSRTKTEVDDMLKPMGLGTVAKAESNESKMTEQFYGRLQGQLEQYHETNGKFPDAITTRKLAGALLVQGTQGAPSSLPAWLGGNSTISAFQSKDTSKFQPAKNDDGWDLRIDKNGNQAYVSPDGKQYKAVQ